MEETAYHIFKRLLADSHGSGIERTQMLGTEDAFLFEGATKVGLRLARRTRYQDEYELVCRAA